MGGRLGVRGISRVPRLRIYVCRPMCSAWGKVDVVILPFDFDKNRLRFQNTRGSRLSTEVKKEGNV